MTYAFCILAGMLRRDVLHHVAMILAMLAGLLGAHRMNKWKLLRRKLRYGFRHKFGFFQEPVVKAEQFGIRAGYRHRPENAFYDDTAQKDQHQREVYEAAAAASKEIGAKKVFDIGCGSGFKLMKFFPDTETVGFDLEPTLSFLRQTYPERQWASADFERDTDQADIVICADVVEHIPNPDLLMQYLSRITRGKLVISTPDRYRVYGWDHSGPPRNRAHCREWSMDEFRIYVERWFNIEDHRITNFDDSTQMIIGTPRSPAGPVA